MEIAELVLKYVDTLVWPIATVALVWGLRHPIKRAMARLSRLETPAGTLEFSAEARELLDEAAVIRDATLSQETEPGAHSSPEALEEERDREVEGRSPQARNGEDERPSDSESRPASEAPANFPQEPEAASNADFLRRVSEVGALTVRRYFATHQLRKSFSELAEVASVSPAGAVITAHTRLESQILESAHVRLGRPEVFDEVDPRHRRAATRFALKEMRASREVMDIYDRLRALRNQAAHSPDSVTADAAVDYVQGCLTVAMAVWGDPGELSGTPGSP